LRLLRYLLWFVLYQRVNIPTAHQPDAIPSLLEAARAQGAISSPFIFSIEKSSGSNDVWRYYSLVRTGRSASKRITGHEASSVNRAVAFYRYLAGIPTNMELTAAR